MAHHFRFYRVGGFDQVVLDRGEDLLALDQLDQKLWVALACPTTGLELDEKTLELIDTDGDHRIRPPEVIAATKWAGTILKDAGDLVKGGDAIELSHIDETQPDGKSIAASARQILSDLGKKSEKAISLADVADTAKIFSQTKFNGDGVLPADSADDDATKQAVLDVIACFGAEVDRSGKDGVTQAKVDAFFGAAEAFDAWHRAAEADATVRPLKDDTAAAADAVAAVRAKVDDWFTRCRLAAFDARAAGPLAHSEAEYATLAPRILTDTGEEVAAFPLARIDAGKNPALPFGSGLNPGWVARMETLRKAAVVPLLGERATLSGDDWAAVLAKLAPFEAWRAKKAGAEVEKLGLARVRELLGSTARADVTALIAKDQALAPEAAAIAMVEKLIRYHRDLYRLLLNFVSFTDFYSRKRKAAFQAGTLYLDGRSCDLAIPVKDPGAHAAIATQSGTFLAYCECTRKDDASKKMTVAVAFTGGDSDNLQVGRNGVFYDRKGKDWDATIIKLVEHPISIRQAFWAPYKFVAKAVGQQVEKFASARDKEMQANAAASAEATTVQVTAPAPAAAPPAPAPAPAAPGAPPPPPPPPPPFDVGKSVGIFAAIGLALGAIGSALAMVATGFLSLKWWQRPIAVAALLLVFSGPSMLLAALKLHRRTIGPILDAAGWAVNARAKMNIPFGGSLTQEAELPEGAERSLDDPFEEKKQPWVFYFFVLCVVAGIVASWKLGYLVRLLHR
ncbi:MAG: hypothetical protein JNL79_01450 [Myxococcales bacterium]|nr:hypothetical protein [Myxococcales bacterium]